MYKDARLISRDSIFHRLTDTQLFPQTRYSSRETRPKIVFLTNREIRRLILADPPKSLAIKRGSVNPRGVLFLLLLEEHKASVTTRGPQRVFNLSTHAHANFCSYPLIVLVNT